MPDRRKRRLRYTRDASLLCLNFLGAVSALITCFAAVRGFPRVGWLAAVTLALLFLNAAYLLRLRGSIKTLKNVRARRRAQRRARRDATRDGDHA